MRHRPYKLNDTDKVGELDELVRGGMDALAVAVGTLALPQSHPCARTVGVRAHGLCPQRKRNDVAFVCTLLEWRCL